MTVYDLLDLCLNDYDYVTIYDFATEENVFNDTVDEAKNSDYSNEEICSWSIENSEIVINVNIQ